jgi:hypothetical protein
MHDLPDAVLRAFKEASRLSQVQDDDVAPYKSKYAASDLLVTARKESVEQADASAEAAKLQVSLIHQSWLQGMSGCCDSLQSV